MVDGGEGANPEPPQPRPLNILWLIKGLGPGGAEQLLVSTAHVADRSRYRFSVAYLLNWKDTLVARLQAEDVSVHCLGVRRARDARWVFRLRRHLRSNEFDIVHVHSPLVAIFARLVILTLAKRPAVVSSEHNIWASYRFGTRVLNRLTFPLDNAHIAVSRQVLESLPAKYRPQVEVIVHGVDVEAIVAARDNRDAVRAEFGLRPEQVAVCTVANLRRAKGYPDLLAAAKTVIDEGHDVVFLAVGQGPLEAEIKAQHAELGLDDRFRLLGYRGDAIQILAASDIFALASLFEGYPIAVMEAMAAGLPIVATDAGGVPDAVHDGVDGFVVPRGDPQALAAALSKVISDPELRASMSQHAAGRGSEFSFAPAIEKTQQIYDRVAGLRGA